MSSSNTDKLKLLLSKISGTTKEELENHLHDFPPYSDQNLLCNFHLITCTSDNIREDDFIFFLLGKIIRYALKSKEYRSLTVDKAWELVAKAKRKFSENGDSAEVGELILFVLLESRGIVQVMQKMGLKMNNRMPVFGMDAVHIGVEDGIILYYGESKMHKNFQSGLSSAISSFEDFSENRKKKKIEVDLISSFIDEGKFGKYTHFITNMVNPYYVNKENFEERNAVFLGYNWDLLCNPQNRGSLTEFLKENFIPLQNRIGKRILKSIQASQKIKKQHFSFYLIPFKDVAEFREMFNRELSKY